jgi:NADH-quinone oxidoreductase subunit G
MKKTSRIAIVCNTTLSNEELFLIHKIFQEDLGMERIFFADPIPGESDNYLLTTDRSPNRRGAQEIGFELKSPNLEVLGQNTDILLVFGHFLQSHFNLGDIKNTLDKIRTKLLFTSQTTSLSPLFDIILPTALVAEKEGSLTNVDGRVQKFSPALETLGESRPEWQVLVSLAKELKSNYKYYYQFTSPEAIFKEMGKGIPFFK